MEEGHIGRTTGQHFTNTKLGLKALNTFLNKAEETSIHSSIIHPLPKGETVQMSIVGGGIGDMWPCHVTQCRSAIAEKEALAHAAIWRSLEALCRRWSGSSAGRSAIPVCQGCRLDPRSGRTRESTNECIISGTTKRSRSLSLALFPSLPPLFLSLKSI